MIVLAWIIGILIFIWAVCHPTGAFWSAVGVWLLWSTVTFSEMLDTIFIAVMIGTVLGWILGTFVMWGNGVNRGAEIVDKLEEHLNEGKK